MVDAMMVRGLVSGSLVKRRSAFALPGTGADGVVLPLLAASDEEHDGAEDEHHESPAEVEVHVERLLIDRGMLRDETKDGHDAADDDEDESKGDADVESHVSPVVSG